MKAAWIWGIAALWAVPACGSVADDSDAGVSIDAPDNGIDASSDIPDAAPPPDAAWECISNFDCNDDNRCSLDTCTVSRQCDNDDLDGVAVPGAIQPPGDCQLLSCESGSEQQVDDDLDIPIDGLECTKDVCTSGTPSNPPEPSGTSCSAGECDGDGNCTGCTSPAECGVDSFCRVYTCIGSVCGVVDTVDGTVLPPSEQVTGDCRRKVCNGAGGTREEPFDSDLPGDDGLECTFETCFMGAPLHPPRAIDTPCSFGFCDGDSACVECNNPSQCSGAGICEVDLCESNNCDIDQEDPGVPAPPEVQTPFDCQVEVCDGLAGYSPIPDDSDLPFDGRECTEDICMGGAPFNPPKPIHTACTEFGGNACNGLGDCVECTLDIHCGAGDTCNTVTWTCNCPAGDCGGLDCDGDGTDECDPKVPFCCDTGFPSAFCAIEHDNGLGEFWWDCEPVGTYNEEQATEACQVHFPGDPGACAVGAGMCGGTPTDADGGFTIPGSDAGPTGDGDVVCGTGTVGFDCACWQFTGVFAGKVFSSPSLCGCPDLTSLTWY